jgi:hypothetical protein
MLYFSVSKFTLQDSIDMRGKGREEIYELNP